MDKEDIKSVIEALLFAWSEPISIKEISKVLSIEVNETKKILHEMINDYNFNNRGIQIIKMDDYYQFSTRAEHHSYINKLFEPKDKKTLSQAALETLAIIAYKQPVTKIEIEEIRGVKCDKALASLQEKSLIEEQGRLEKVGRPIVYGTNINFLKAFGLTSIKDLPHISKFESLLEEE